MRIFAQASKPEPLGALAKSVNDTIPKLLLISAHTIQFTYYIMQQFSGGHFSLDLRTAAPKPFIAFYPATIPQSSLSETLHFLSPTKTAFPAGHPPTYATLAPRLSYDPSPSSALPVASNPTRTVPLGSLALGRSGDKGANVNIGLFISTTHAHADAAYAFLRGYLTRARMRQLMGDDWRAEYAVERVEFPRIRAVHFVVYGVLGRGVSSASRLDGLGKGFADWLRDRWVDVPEELVVAGGEGLGSKL